MGSGKDAAVAIWERLMSKMTARVKRGVRAAMNRLGLDLVPVRSSPTLTLCGLRTLPIRTVIDVGANIGQFAQMALRRFPMARVIAFEPVPEAFQSLVKLSKTYKGRFLAFNVALGDFEGFTEMYVHLRHSMSSSLLPTTDRAVELYPFKAEQVRIPIRMSTLDTELDRISAALHPEMLVKLDVQGFEDRVIRGGVRTFERAVGCIIEVSLEELYEGQASFMGLVQLLHELGFRYGGNMEQFYGPMGQVVFLDAVFVKSSVLFR